MSPAVDRVIVAALGSVERRVTAPPSGSLTVGQARAVLGELGRGLAAVVDALDGGTNEYVPGAVLTWLTQGPADGSLLDGIARVLCGSPAPQANEDQDQGRREE